MNLFLYFILFFHIWRNFFKKWMYFSDTQVIGWMPDHNCARRPTGRPEIRNVLIYDWQIGGLADWPIDQLTNWLIDGLMDWRIDKLTDWWNWRIDGLTGLTIDIDWLIDGLTYWEIDWLTIDIDWLMDWRIEGLAN